MTKDTKTESTGVKKKYEKPLLITIDLVAEEVLAINCKTPGGGGKFFRTCQRGARRPCFSRGS